jgi:hypothetical protein
VRTTAGYAIDVKLEQREQRKILASLKDRERSCISSDSNEAGPSGEKRHPVFYNDLTMPLRKVEDFKRFEKQLDLPDIRNNLVSYYMFCNLVFTWCNEFFFTFSDSCNQSVWG